MKTHREIELEKEVAAWRVLAERASKHLAESIHGEDCLRSDECDDADHGECGRHCADKCPACDCGVVEWHETAAALNAALAGVATTKPGSDIVPTTEPKPSPGLPRYGMYWSESEGAHLARFPDGYWTPWRLAQAQVAKAIEALKKVEEIACRSGPIIGYGEEPPEPLNPDGCELALLARETIAVLGGGK